MSQNRDFSIWDVFGNTWVAFHCEKQHSEHACRNKEKQKPVLAKEREARFNIQECRRVLKQRKQIVTELSKTVKPKKVIVRGRAGGTHFKAL